MSNSGRKNSKGAVPNQVQLGAAENLVNKKSKVRCCITDALTKLMVTPCWLVIAGDGANSDLTAQTSGGCGRNIESFLGEEITATVQCGLVIKSDKRQSLSGMKLYQLWPPSVCDRCESRRPESPLFSAFYDLQHSLRTQKAEETNEAPTWLYSRSPPVIAREKQP